MRGVGYIYHFASHESAEGNHSAAAHAEATATLSPNIMSPHPICGESKLQSTLPCLDQMSKGTCPNSPLYCHASVHLWERGAWTWCLRCGKIDPNSNLHQNLQSVEGMALAGRGEGQGWVNVIPQ